MSAPPADLILLEPLVKLKTLDFRTWTEDQKKLRLGRSRNEALELDGAHLAQFSTF